MKTIVVIYSGGMDSFTLLNYAQEKNYRSLALSFDYGQRHTKELDYAKSFCATQSIDHKVIDISNIKQLLKGSALTDKLPIPHGHYEDKRMQIMVVPNRNMIFFSLAVSYALSSSASEVWFGAHQGDRIIYPDCRPDFIEKMDQLSSRTWSIGIQAPFLSLNKTQILSKGIELGLDYSQTWTCYEGEDRACGKCGACVERLEAFAANRIVDPLEYR